MTDKQIVQHTNALAQRFYEMQGCAITGRYKFYRATHPAERLCWDMDVAAMEHIAKTDVEKALKETGIK